VLDRHYVYKICSPSRCALQSGRNPVHVNVLNDAIGLHNPSDLDAGQQGIPRNMTTIAAKLAGAGYSTHAVGKWVCRLRRTRTCALARAHTTDQAAPQRPNPTPGLAGGTRAWRGRT
jgi:arylsulfatase A-like enzyme